MATPRPIPRVAQGELNAPLSPSAVFMSVVKEGPVAEGFGAKGFQWWLYERGLCPDWKGDRDGHL